MYSELYEAWQREIDNPTLQSLPADFYVRVADYVRTIREETHVTDKKAFKTTLLEQELKNVNRIVKQLTQMRYRKIAKLLNAGHELPSDMIAAEEAQLSKGYLPFVEGYRAFAKSLLQGNQPQQTNIEEPTATVPPLHKRVTLRFVKAVPMVVGGDLKMYGPFVPEDVASVPVDNANLLVKQGFAVVVDVS